MHKTATFWGVGGGAQQPLYQLSRIYENFALKDIWGSMKIFWISHNFDIFLVCTSLNKILYKLVSTVYLKSLNEKGNFLLYLHFATFADSSHVSILTDKCHLFASNHQNIESPCTEVKAIFSASFAFLHDPGHANIWQHFWLWEKIHLFSKWSEPQPVNCRAIYLMHIFQTKYLQ